MHTQNTIPAVQICTHQTATLPPNVISASPHNSMITFPKVVFFLYKFCPRPRLSSNCTSYNTWKPRLRTLWHYWLSHILINYKQQWYHELNTILLFLVVHSIESCRLCEWIGQTALRRWIQCQGIHCSSSARSVLTHSQVNVNIAY
jgi:hypothetical protein